jgi:phosphoserine phosphatase
LLRELYEPVVQRVRQHLGRGDVVVLMSGTLQPIAQALAKHCGVEHLSATLPNQRDGRFTGQPPDVHPFDTAKLALATEFAARHGLDLAQAAAYGDSRHDLALLRAVGEPVAVLPDRSLLREALERGWEVVPSNHATEREFRFTKPQRSRYM